MVQFLVRKLGPVGRKDPKSETEKLLPGMALVETYRWHCWCSVRRRSQYLKRLSFWLSNASGDALRKNLILDWMDSDHVDKSLWPYQLLEMLDFTTRKRGKYSKILLDKSKLLMDRCSEATTGMIRVSCTTGMLSANLCPRFYTMGFSKGDW